MRLETIPKISVGILNSNEIRFFLRGTYNYNGNRYKDSKGIAKILGDKIIITIAGNVFRDECCVFIAENDSSYFEIFDVIIGLGFHWERSENQQFKGDLKIINENKACTAINIVSLEDYLESVISSEMSANASINLLKAHAVISRSWLLAQIIKRKEINETYKSCFETEDELIKWYDREDHDNYDVCADDHCQRYQGIIKIATDRAEEAVCKTKGEVLMFNNEVCDARFSKCCGGVVESYEEVWEPEPKEYLIPLSDSEDENIMDIDLKIEEQAIDFIKQTPTSFCNTKNPKIIAEILNDYDQETDSFYRWRVVYTQEELSEIVKTRSGIDYGLIKNLIPIERGYSGRLKKLKIVGTKRTRIIGKELEIRKTLSRSHLYSSAFYVEKKEDNFVLHGAGWGHGVGLCQIGAAVMGSKGYPYKEILKHYFKSVDIKTLYR